MKVIAINGSPRKSWNTAVLLNNFVKGAQTRGALTELINLYDYNYKGCISCFSCKLKGGKSYGCCAFNDELKPVLGKIEEADAIIIGSPIYFGSTTGMVRSFLERLLFQYLVYDAQYSSLFKKRIKTGFIYTMNVNEQTLEDSGYLVGLNRTEMTMQRTFGHCEALYVTDTYQFDNYSKYETSGFNEEFKAKRKTEVFPEDCKKAYEMGIRFTEKS